MSKEHKTTEFSAHISRSKMRRYLHDQLKTRESAEVETHLKHCERCSQSIIQYIEEEEPENYKLHIKKLKGIIVEAVNPKEPRFNTVQIKSMRAAAAVVILVAFSFFAFENLIEKDFSLVANPEKQEENFKRKNVFAEDTQNKTTKVAAVQPKKDTEDKETKAEPKVEKPAEAKIAKVTPKKTTPKKAKPETEVKKADRPQLAEKKESKPVQPEATVSETPKVADNTTQKVENSEEDKKEEVIKANPVAQVEKEETQKEQESMPQPVAPIQKLEKVNLDEGSNNLTKKKPVQVVPSASAGQLLQRE